MGLVALALAAVAGPIEANWGGRYRYQRNIQADRQVTFRQFLRTDIADESEAVAVLEVGLSDDVALEASGGRDYYRRRAASRNTTTVA